MDIEELIAGHPDAEQEYASLLLAIRRLAEEKDTLSALLEEAQRDRAYLLERTKSMVDFGKLKDLADEIYDSRSSMARRGKIEAEASGDASEYDCFKCELHSMSAGFSSWMLAYHEMTGGLNGK